MTGGADGAQRIEWALGIASALIVLAMTAYLAREGIGGSDTLPVLAVAAVDASPAPGQIRFVVANRGGRTAQAVSVALTLRDGGRAVERRRLTIDYVPAHSEVAGGFVLPPDAGRLEAEVEVEGYLDP